LTVDVIVDAVLLFSFDSITRFAGSTTTLEPALVNTPDAVGVTLICRVAVPGEMPLVEIVPPVKVMPDASAVPT
jgi:hypothetical protein